MLSPIDNDLPLRMAAFRHVRTIEEQQGHLTSTDLRLGFQFQGERIPLINPQRGIFKPQRMRFLLSIRTVYPKSGARVWYDDQRQVHSQIYSESEAIDYSFMGTNPASADNQYLRLAMENAVPFIYFLGIAPQVYKAISPAYVIGWDAANLRCKVAFGVGASVLDRPETSAERRYALREVKQRLHQATFREAVIAAYDGRCALSGFPEPSLLDAAHIMADTDVEFGQPVIQNGLPLSKIHHAAFDSHLIGIDPDFRIHVAPRLLSINDGPMLEAIKSLNGEALRVPRRAKDYPDRARLERRFEVFRRTSL